MMLGRFPVVLTVVFALFLATAGLYLLTQEVPDFFDPCHGWDMGSGPQEVRSSDECPERSGTSETKMQAAVRLALVQGGWVATAVLVLAGVALGRPSFLGASGVVYALYVIPTGLSLGFAFLAPALVAFLAARVLAQERRSCPAADDDPRVP